MITPDIEILNAEIPRQTIREPRIGIMLHLDASASDEGSLAWFSDPRCRCAYHYLVLDDGRIVRIVSTAFRAWHAGKCKPADGFNYMDANSAFYGVAAAARAGDTITNPQMEGIAKVCEAIAKAQNWNLRYTLTGHSTQAWPRGRKIDPECDPDNPVLSKEMVLEHLGIQ